MKLAIVGSRKITEVNIGKYIKIMPSLIISGGAAGVDTAAELWAESKGIATEIIKPEYGRYKKAAPLIRNRAIVEMCDLLIAFWDGESKGTIHAINYAKKLGKCVEVFEM